MEYRELKSEDLYHRCDPESFSFETTEDLEDLDQFVGQPRAVESLQFGIDIAQEGYNIFALGQEGTGKHHLVRKLLEAKAASKEIPPEFCYVNNFKEGHKPRLLRMPPGKGRELSEDMEKLVEEARNALKAAFENEEYQNRLRGITHEFHERQQQAFEELQKKTEEKDLTLMRLPAGFAFAPVREGNVLPPEEFKKLPEEERKQMEEKVEEVQKEAQKIMQKIPSWEKEMREKVKELNREISNLAVGPLLEELKKKYKDLSQVIEYIEDVQKDMFENVGALLPGGEGQAQDVQAMLSQQSEKAALRRYQVNVLVDHSKSQGGPVVYEDHPSYNNLVGRVEHLPHMGTLLTDFNMIRSGALHRANGGYLILDALKVLLQPFAWDALKRALRSQKAKIESMGELYGLISTVNLDPEPVPLNLKVVMMGTPRIFYLLQYHDPEFPELFKVGADFDVQMNRTPESQEQYSRLIGSMARQKGLRPFDRDGVARIIERSARMVGDGERLSVHMQSISDLLRESDYWASRNGNGKVTGSDVERAVEAWIYRSDRLRQRMQEEIKRGTILIDTEGEKIGQLNGLSVIQLGDFAFGRPNRITARVRLGKGEVVDIEREVEMGGPIHSKGVLILAGFLGARYAMDQPLSFSASLVFEQSYSGIEGDSASSAELYALLSAIGEIPLKQSLAVTGSVNQHGQIQPIGGVNEKIEGFFDTCRARELSGEQGVLIPASNVKHLMLRKDVLEAAKEGKFHIYAVETIDQGIEILTGVQAGIPDEKGEYPENSVNGKVRARLAGLAEKQRKFREPNAQNPALQ
jgi:lon-related putative ATP-dependent protease